MARIAFLGIVCAISAQIAAQYPPLTSSKTVPPPKPVGTDRFVGDESTLIVPGKALFWDRQAGSAAAQRAPLVSSTQAPTIARNTNSPVPTPR